LNRFPSAAIEKVKCLIKEFTDYVNGPNFDIADELPLVGLVQERIRLKELQKGLDVEEKLQIKGQLLAIERDIENLEQTPILLMFMKLLLEKNNILILGILAESLKDLDAHINKKLYSEMETCKRLLKERSEKNLQSRNPVDITRDLLVNKVNLDILMRNLFKLLGKRKEDAFVGEFQSENLY